MGKSWNRETDSEKGNYDYLMGADLDTDNPEVIQETRNWGKWYQDTVHMDGFRMDAVKHISFAFCRDWLAAMREQKKDLYVVGEYWSHEVGKLTHYLEATGRALSLFDVPLHFRFLEAATSNGNFDLSRLFENTLTAADPACSVTFVDNHDTQPGQALCSFIPAWFKPIAYALILLRDQGTPCVFYGDYYGIPHDGVPPVPQLDRLIKIRERYAYGPEHLFFDDSSLVGFTRGRGRGASGLRSGGPPDGRCWRQQADVCGPAAGGPDHVGCSGPCHRDCADRRERLGTFSVQGGSVSVWLTESALKYLYLNI